MINFLSVSAPDDCPAPERAYRLTAAFLAGYPSSAPAWAIQARKASPEHTTRQPIGSWLIRDSNGLVFCVDHHTKLSHPHFSLLSNDVSEVFQ